MAVVVRDAALDVGQASWPCGSRVVRIDVGGTAVLGVYGVAADPVRYGSSRRRERKRRWLTEFSAMIDAQATRPGPLLVIGDLNIVDPDDREGLPYVLPEERATYDHLRERGMTDAYRAARVGSRPTWVDHTGAGCRYDHAFTRDLVVHGAEIDDTPREAGHTDHSALAVAVCAPS